MIRLGKQIRLTVQEQRDFIASTGFSAPRTVAGYNRIIDMIAVGHDASETSEGRLLAALIRGDRLVEHGQDISTALEISHYQRMATLGAALEQIRVTNGRIVRPTKRDVSVFETITGFKYPRTLRMLRQYRGIMTRQLHNSKGSTRQDR